MSTYRVVITSIEERIVTKRGEFVILDRIPWTTEELDKRDDTFYHHANMQDKEPLHEIRGYAPSYEELEKVETQILAQTVESIDLAAVIRAINGLDQPESKNPRRTRSDAGKTRGATV